MVKSDITIKVGCGVNEAIVAARRAIQLCHWKVTKLDSSSIKASTGISMTSWGETIIVRAKDINGQTYLNISSEFVFGLVDLMKTNKKNITKVVSFMRGLCQVID